MVDHSTETTQADGEKPTKSWQDMLVPPEAGGEPAADGVPRPDAAAGGDDAAKNPLDELLSPDKTTDPDQPETLNEALDEIAGAPVPEEPTLTEQLLAPHTGTGKPGDPRYTKSPLESPIVNADPSVIAQQQAKVAAAEQNLAAAQAAADATARQDYMDGAGPGPHTGQAVPLAQDVFDARAELTEQRDVLVGLNEAAAETGLPTAAVSDLPANADVQAFTPDPGVTAEEFIDAQKFYSHEVSELSGGLVPDVAEVVDVYANWGEHSGGEQLGAVLDTIGAVPGAGKAFDKLGDFGFDAVEAFRHTDDVPTVVDDLAGTAAHVDPPPDLPHIDMKMRDDWSEFQQSQMHGKMEAFNNAVGDQGFSQVPPAVRDPAVRQEFLESLGLDRVPPGFHVDHTRDLQAGGLDELNNMGLLDGSVNSSFGSQLNKGMNQFPPRTIFGGVRLPDP